jgi:hypothetical protein
MDEEICGTAATDPDIPAQGVPCHVPRLACLGEAVAEYAKISTHDKDMRMIGIVARGEVTPATTLSSGPQINPPSA